MQIEFYSHKKIDKCKWDQTLRRAKNGLVYGLSGYLDIACPNWSALISTNYEYVLPIPQKSKYGLYYIPKVLYIQKFAVFSELPVTEKILAEFLSKIPKKYCKIDINIDTNYFPKLSSYHYKMLDNYELALNKSYDELYPDFSKSHRKNIRCAMRNELEVSVNSEIHNVVAMQKEVFKIKRKDLLSNTLDKLPKLLSFSQNQNPPHVYSAYYQSELCAAAYFMKFGNRYTIFSGTNAVGRKTQAMYLIINNFIEDHSESPAVLDFAGSNLKGIARRNKGFGAKLSHYCQVQKTNPLLQAAETLRSLILK